MSKSAESVSRIALLGLSVEMAAQLGKVLSDLRQTVYMQCLPDTASSLSWLDEVHADLVFCAAAPDYYGPLLEAIKQQRPGLPLIVVSPWPDVSRWLDALQAGASDYCVPPFESAPIRWIVEGARKFHRTAA